MKKLFFLFASFFLFFTPTLANEIPEYTSGSVTLLGNVGVLSERDVEDIEDSINIYETKTHNEIGIVVVDDSENFSSSWNRFLSELTDKGYTPNAFLLVVGIEDRKSHLFVDTRVEGDGLWNSGHTSYVLDSLLPQYFRNENFEGGLLDFVEYVEETLPRDVEVRKQELIEQEKLAETAKREAREKLVRNVLFIIGGILGIYAGYKLVQRIRLKRMQKAISTYYNEQGELFLADLEGVQDLISEKELQNIGEEYKKSIEDLQKEIEHYFEQEEKTFDETQKIYKKLELLENEFTSFINDWENIEKELQEKKNEMESLKKRIEEEVEKTNA